MSALDYEYCAHPTTYSQPRSPVLQPNGDGTWYYVPQVKVTCATCGVDLSDGLKAPCKMPGFDEARRLGIKP